MRVRSQRPGRLTPGTDTRYPLHRRLGGPQGRSGQVQKHTRTGNIISTGAYISPPVTFRLKRSWRNWMSGLMYMCLMLKAAGSRDIYSRDPTWKSGDCGGSVRYSCEQDPSGTRPNTPETGTTNRQFRGSSNRSVNSANSWGSGGRQHEARQQHHHTQDIIVYRGLSCTVRTPNMDKSCQTIQQNSTCK